jgi:phosphoribosylamine--glycine ligase
MRLLIIDYYGEALDFALRCQGAGHDVRHFIGTGEKEKFIGRGLVQRVSEYQPWVRWAELVFFADNTKYLHDFDTRWRPEGTKVIGPTAIAAAWELNRTEGMKTLKKAGVETPAYREFSDYDQAIAYVKKEDRAFVSKPCGDESDKALSYVAKSPADMVYMLGRWKRLGKHKAPFILQEFVAGIEFAVGGWFGPAGFNVGWCENFEFKKLMNGDMGMATGEQGTVLRYTRNSRLARKVLAPLEAQLHMVGYVGYVDVNCIIDEKGQPWPLEFTMRPGWPTFNIQQELHAEPVAWLMDLWNGTDSKAFDLDTIVTGVVMSIPDYPYSHLTRKEVVGVPIYGLMDLPPTSMHPCQLMRGEAPAAVEGKLVDKMPQLVTAGDYLLVMTGTGSSVKESAAIAYRHLKRLIVPNSPMYRTDIGSRLKTQIPRLQAKGYATGMAYSTTP